MVIAYHENPGIFIKYVKGTQKIVKWGSLKYTWKMYVNSIFNLTSNV